jgi:hypothetical protein
MSQIIALVDPLPAPVPMAHIVGEIDHTGKVWKPVQPAPVQPVAWMHEWDDGECIPMLRKRDVDSSDIDSPKSVRPLVYGDTAPPAQPAVPDALTSADIQEHIEYVAGWNDCRQAMREMMK